MTDGDRPSLKTKHLALAREMLDYGTQPWLSPVESEAFAASAELLLAYLRGEEDLSDKPHTRTLIALCVGGPIEVGRIVTGDGSPLRPSRSPTSGRPPDPPSP